MSNKTNPAEELRALQHITRELEKLDPDSQQRVMRWLNSAYPSNPPSDSVYLDA